MLRVAAALAILAACHGGEHAAPSPIVDLSASLEPLQREFAAHAGEARFLTLLSPT